MSEMADTEQPAGDARSRYRDAENRVWEAEGASPQERWVRLQRTGTRVRIQELGEGPDILFIHGASNSGTSWASLAARLDGFHCLLLDRPGCGLSEPIEAFPSLEALTGFTDSLVTDVLDGLDLSHAHLVSTSYGGYSALRAAATHPERVDRIVNFGWTAGAPVRPLPFFMRAAAIPAVGRMMTRMPVNERIVRSMFRRIGLKQALAAGRVGPEVVRSYLALLRHTDTMRNELTTSRWVMTFKGVNDQIVLPPESLGALKAPMYFMWGEEDPFGDADIARRFVAQIPNAELELIPGAGHAVWLDDPDGSAEKTRSFLARAT